MSPLLERVPCNLQICRLAPWPTHPPTRVCIPEEVVLRAIQVGVLQGQVRQALHNWNGSV
jgi:hypothetical protein